MQKPFKLKNKIQNYAWGRKGSDSCIPGLAGVKPEPDAPYAEWWMGTHPKAPSTIQTDAGEISLAEFIAAAPDELLGTENSSKFGSRLPFLFKVLSAGEALSIQTHPNKEQAEELHAKDPGHYPDNNHKPEIAIALSPMKALAGFLPRQEMLEMLNRYTEISGFIGGQDVNEYRAVKAIDTSGGLRRLFERLMRRGTDDTAALERSLSGLEQRLENTAELAVKDRLFLGLRKKYGTDIGLLAIYFLNYLQLSPGEAIFTGPGIPHAYLEGDIVECMASSDNVVRAGLTPKFKDVETLINILTYEHGSPEIMRPGEQEEYLYPAAAQEFEVLRIEEHSGGEEHLMSGPSILLVTEGELQIYPDAEEQQKLSFKRGEAWFLPAECRLRLSAGKGAKAFVAKVP